MALVECPECKKQVSDTAKVCPSCGYKLDAEKVKKRNKIIKRSILFILLATIVIGLSIYIPYELERTRKAKLAFERWLEESGKPETYDDLRHFLYGGNPEWEPIEEMMPALRTIVKAHELKLNNVPFELTDAYLNWTKYARRKKHN